MKVRTLMLAAALAAAAMVLFAAAVPAQEAAPAAPTVQAAPTGWAGSKIMWASLTMIFATFATSWAQSRIGIAGAGALAEKPELAGTYIILIAIPETMVILGFVVSAMIIMME